MKECLIPYFGGNEKYYDVNSVLRVPDFNSWKDKENPFMINKVYIEPDNKYSWEQMDLCFPKYSPIIKCKHRYTEKNKGKISMEDLWNELK